MQLYLVDVGVLLPRNHKEFEFYSTVYDHRYGYYDENQYISKYEGTLNDIENYVKNGVEGTYGVLTYQGEFPDDTIIDEDFDLFNCNYSIESVVFSLCKKNGELVFNFIEKRGV